MIKKGYNRNINAAVRLNITFERQNEFNICFLLAFCNIHH